MCEVFWQHYTHTEHYTTDMMHRINDYQVTVYIMYWST